MHAKFTHSRRLCFIENLRMSHAEQLLLDGEMNVRSIAEQVGYQNPTTFYNAFKRKHSCTPTQWLNLHQPM